MNTNPNFTPKKSCIIEPETSETPYLIQFCLQDGTILALPYGHLLECTHSEKDGLEYVYLLFSTKTVALKGLRLVPLVQLLSSMKVQAICMVADENELKDKSGPWVASMQWRQSSEEVV